MRAGTALAAFVCLCFLLAAVLAAGPAGAKRQGHSQRVEIEVQFHRVGPGGTEVREKGMATGTFPGPVTTRLVFRGNKMNGTFALHTTGGTVTGRTNATAVGSTARPLVHYAGTVTITGGTGRFRTASGTLDMTGTMRRINNAVYEKTTGTIHF
jgi:hypothetical protein